MKGFLDQLDPESILMLYLVGELSPADQQEVDRRLAADGELRAQLQAMRALHESFDQAMQSAEENRVASIPDGVAIRRASRLMRQWVLSRRVPETPQEIRESIPWLRYGLSAAAVLLLAGTVWYRAQPQPLAPVAPAPAPVAVQSDTIPPDEKLEMVADTMDSADDAPNQQLAALAGGRTEDAVFSTEMLTQDEPQ
jgi:anti-sigma factor RsiW